MLPFVHNNNTYHEFLQRTQRKHKLLALYLPILTIFCKYVPFRFLLAFKFVYYSISKNRDFRIFV